MKKALLTLVSMVIIMIMAGSAFALSAEEKAAEDAAWKKEPAYGQTLKLGYSGGLCNGPIGIAYLKGYYEAEGLAVEIVRVTGGQETDALGTGKIVAATNHIAAMLVPTVNGVRIKFTAGQHSGCKSIYVPANSPIKSTSDMVGTTMAIPDGIGGPDHNIGLRFLAKDKVDITQVKVKVVEAGAAVQAMQNGEIQSAVLSDQFARGFLDRGELRIVRSLTFDDDFKQEACCIHAVNLDFYTANPMTVKKLTRAHEMASEWMAANPEEAVRTLQANSWAAGDYDLVLSIFKTYNFTISDDQTEKTLRDIIADYKEFGLISQAKDTDAIMQQIWDPVVADEFRK